MQVSVAYSLQKLREKLPWLAAVGFLFAMLLGAGALANAQEAAPEGPPSSLTLRFLNEGQPLEQDDLARFYIYPEDERDKYVAWGHGAKTAHFPGGTYDLVIRFEDGAARRTIERKGVELSW